MTKRVTLRDVTATAHALIGGAIAASIPNPAIGLPLAALSHPIADMIPHWDFGLGWKKKTKLLLFIQASFDLLFGIALTFLLFKDVDKTYLISAIFLSEVWDILQMPYLLFNWKFFPFSAFYNFGHDTNGRAKLPWGILTQAATVGGLVFALRFVH